MSSTQIPRHDAYYDARDVETTLFDSGLEEAAAESEQTPPSQRELLMLKSVRKRAKAAFIHEDFDPVTGQYAKDPDSEEKAIIAAIEGEDGDAIALDTANHRAENDTTYQMEDVVPDGSVKIRRRIRNTDNAEV